MQKQIYFVDKYGMVHTAVSHALMRTSVDVNKIR